MDNTDLALIVIVSVIDTLFYIKIKIQSKQSEQRDHLRLALSIKFLLSAAILTLIIVLSYLP